MKAGVYFHVSIASLPFVFTLVEVECEDIPNDLLG